MMVIEHTNLSQQLDQVDWGIFSLMMEWRRINLKLSHCQLAKQLGISFLSIMAMSRGARLSADSFTKLCACYANTPDMFYQETIKNKRSLFQ